jgi:3',5'-cyclic AMP phosphodiesterase CpdA
VRRKPSAALALLLLAGATASCVQPAAPTAQPPTAPPVVDAGFIAFADSGTGDATQLQVADQMERWAAAPHRVDALVVAGDAVYPDGDPSRFTATLDVPYADLRATRPLWVALGNHDVQNGHGGEQLAYIGLPEMPYVKTLPEVQLLFLDGNDVGATQAQWLDARLSEPGPALRVVVFHQPAYSCASHGGTPTIQQWWVPILEEHRVALVITGHDHYYERFLSPNDVTYVVTGGGGADLYARNPGCTGVPQSQATATRHHFVGVEVTDGALTLTAVARTGETLDQTTITR